MNTLIDRIKNLQNDLLDIQDSGKAQVIFRWYGHANNFQFDVYIPRWAQGKESDYSADYFFENKDARESFAKSEETIKLLKKLICNEQVSAAIDNSPKLVHEYTYTRTEGGNTVSNY
jgi:hypothetical protein